MPTGVALGDPRRQLFDAAERVLRRDGVSGLTSRSVTVEAGVAKGVLHRHFSDFDSFLAELVWERVTMIKSRAADLLSDVGRSSVIINVNAAMVDVFDRDTGTMITLVSARATLKQRLQDSQAGRVPLIDQVVEMLRAYITAEQEIGRVRHDADPATAARTLAGAAHLVLMGAPDQQPARGITRSVEAIVGPILTVPSSRASEP